MEVGILGATGTVGRCLIELLSGHPWFTVAEVAGSPGSAGRRLGEAMGRGVAGRALESLILKYPGDEWESPLILSAIPGKLASALEGELADRGHIVVSNASAYRMDPQVPLVIPEINADHLSLADAQANRWPGAIITNPNCSVVGLALALAPLHRAFGVEAVVVTTLQAISGAGRPGPAAADLVDNVVPGIPGEELKIASEPQKILGTFTGDAIEPAGFVVSASTHRVPVLHGHQLAVSVKLAGRASPVLAAETMREFGDRDRSLPSAPERPLIVLEEERRPQPRLDRDAGGGMSVCIGGVRQCDVLDVKFSVLVHNLIRGAAGAALLNAELCHKIGLAARSRVT